jgi:hypothetical protein
MMLMLMSAAMWMCYAGWTALLNNFAIERASFTGAEIGILQSIREVPGFLAVTAVAVMLVMREQVFALVFLAVLGIGTAMTGFFPTALGLYATTLLMSVGFHYQEVANQSLGLQWLSKAEAPRQFGRIIAAGAFASLTAYALIFVIFEFLELDFALTYLAIGGIAVAIAIFIAVAFPRIDGAVPQRRHLVLRRRYWLYYALTFAAGARRQIFVVFAGFLMVERFGYSVGGITALFLINCLINMAFAARIGGLIGHWGERRALIFEYVGLIGVFTAYAFVANHWVAAGLYIVDHVFFALAIAMKTYFQKIGDPADMAPTASVAFSINHIAAIFIPITFGLIWLWSPSAVFLIGAAIAVCSLILAFLVPHQPAPGAEVVWPRAARRWLAPAE